jgi:hypothetical protein
MGLEETEKPKTPRGEWLQKARTLLQDEDAVRGVAAAALLAAVAGGSAWVFTPVRYSQHIPDEEALNSIAPARINAWKDFSIEDPETTELKREEAQRQIRSVYDYHTGTSAQTRTQIAQAFALMRGALEGLPARPGAPRRAEWEEIQRRLAPHRDEFVKTLQAVIEPADMDALARLRFSAEVERLAARIATDATGRMIVQDRALLAAERMRGITARRVPGNDERTVDAADVPDLVSVSTEVDRLTAELGADLAPEARRAVAGLVRRLLRPTLVYNGEETQARQAAAREAVKPVVVQLIRGEKVIDAGERIEKRHMVIFRGMRKETVATDLVQVRLGVAIFAAVLAAALWLFARRNVRKFRVRPRDMVLLASMLVGMLALVRLSLIVSDALRDKTGLLSLESYYLAIPFAAGAMLVRILLNSEVALVWAAVFAPLAGLLADKPFPYAAYALVGSVVAADRAAHAKDRTDLFRAGLWAGLAQAAVLVAFTLMGRPAPAEETAMNAAAAFVGGALLVPVIVIGVAPLLESLFGYVTDIKLLELASLNHPVLKELIVQAPGTYHHSIIIGQLVEQAARSAHANPLLARVGAYYHDIGKSRNPLYFGENQKGENRHDKLTPSMSALIIKRHVLEGMEFARQHKLPEQIVAFIPQHHGTRRIGYFWHKAKENAERDGEPMPNEADYRYPGPKPQSREAALVMIADSVEASAKSIPDPTPERLRGLVQKIINNIFADGQLDECELTLKDLNAIARSFYATLEGIYHTRPEYQEPPTKERRPGLAPVPAPEELEIVDGGAQPPQRRASDRQPPEPEPPSREALKRLGM